MAYTPKTWVCGETITDAGLNNIEKGIQEALAGGGSSLPEVTSADDGKVLTVVDGEWDKADKDFKCSSDTIFNGSVTTSGSSTHTASFTLAKAIVADSVVVTFNGTEYECKVREEQGTGSTILQVMGGNSTESFPGYPFRISVVKNATSATIYTAANGTYTLNISKVSAETSDCFETAVKSVIEVGYNCVGDDVETSDCFEKAVKSVVEAGYECTEGRETVIDATVTTNAMPWGSMGDFPMGTPFPFAEGDNVIVTFDGTEHECTVYADSSIPAMLLIGDMNVEGFNIGCDTSATETNPPILNTPSPGTYSVQIAINGTTVETSDCFEKAVKSVLPETLVKVSDFLSISTNEYKAYGGSLAAGATADLILIWSGGGFVGGFDMIKGVKVPSGMTIDQFYFETDNDRGRVVVRNVTNAAITYNYGDISMDVVHIEFKSTKTYRLIAATD